MGLLRVVADLGMNASDLARDRVQNVFWFKFDDADPAASVPEAFARVTDFYNDDPGSFGTVSNKISTAIDRTDTLLEGAFVDESSGVQVGDPFGGPLDFDAADIGSLSLPNETALVLSFKNADPSSSVPIRRRRGRLYIGPFDAQYNETAGGAGHGRPTEDLVNSIAAAGANLLASNTALTQWVIYSRPFAGRPAGPGGEPPEIPARDGTTTLVTDGWVDNEWDTQRRRGRSATSRTTFPA